MPDATFAERLKLKMGEKNLKQADLIREAQILGKKLGKSQVSQYVSGKTLPRRDVAAVLAQVLEVDATWLLHGAAAASEAARASKPGSVPATSTVHSSQSANADKRSSSSKKQGSTPMREFKKSDKLENVLYDVRGPVVDEAARMEENGARIL